MRPEPPSSESIVEYRLGHLETEIKEMRAEGSANAARVQLQLEGIQAKFEGFTSVLPDKFMPRREAEAEHLEIKNRIKTLEDRSWTVVLAIITGLISIGVAALTWFVHKPG